MQNFPIDSGGAGVNGMRKSVSSSKLGLGNILRGRYTATFVTRRILSICAGRLLELQIYLQVYYAKLISQA